MTLWDYQFYSVVVVYLLSCIQLLQRPQTVAHQAPLSMDFSRQEYWSGLPFPSPGDLRDPGIKPRSPALQADSLLTELPGKLFLLYSVINSFSPTPWHADPQQGIEPGAPCIGSLES